MAAFQQLSARERGQMYNQENMEAVIIETLASLVRSGIIAAGTTFTEESVVLGKDSKLDSLGFVTFISDLEERLSDLKGEDVFLVLNDISDFNTNNPSLTVRILASYLESLMGAEG